MPKSSKEYQRVPQSACDCKSSREAHERDIIPGADRELVSQQETLPGLTASQTSAAAEHVTASSQSAFLNSCQLIAPLFKTYTKDFWYYLNEEGCAEIYGHHTISRYALWPIPISSHISAIKSPQIQCFAEHQVFVGCFFIPNVCRILIHSHDWVPAIKHDVLEDIPFM